MSELTPEAGGKSFEQLKQRNEHGAEYWSARDLQPLLGYSQWRRFENAVQKAKMSCQQSGNEPDDHFAGAGKMIDLGKGGQRDVPDYHLSRFTCYLIAQNGDPRKSEIAHAQKYFAIQTRPCLLGKLADVLNPRTARNSPSGRFFFGCGRRRCRRR